MRDTSPRRTSTWLSAGASGSALNFASLLGNSHLGKSNYYNEVKPYLIKSISPNLKFLSI